MKRCASARLADPRGGFSLLEALAALVIASMILAAVAALGAQILRNWNRGADTIASLEMLQRGLGRLSTDLASALPLRPPGAEDGPLLFRGDQRSMIFPAATGFGAGNRGLELVSLNIGADPAGAVMLRRRGPVANLGTVLGDPVPLIRGRVGMAFAYRAADGTISETWADRPVLPAAILVMMQGASGASLFPAPFVIPLETNLSVACLVGAEGGSSSDSEKDGDDEGASSRSSSRSSSGSSPPSSSESQERGCEDESQVAQARTTNREDGDAAQR